MLPLETRGEALAGPRPAPLGPGDLTLPVLCCHPALCSTERGSKRGSDSSLSLAHGLAPLPIDSPLLRDP